MTSTIRKNKSSIHTEILETKGKERFAFTKDTTLVSYITKKNKHVVLPSTLHKNDKIEQNA